MDGVKAVGEGGEGSSSAGTNVGSVWESTADEVDPVRATEAPLDGLSPV